MKGSLRQTIRWVVIGAIFFAIAGLKSGYGQFSIGAAYYQRKEAPQNGFGARMENDIKVTPKILRLGVQAHFDYYSESNKLDGSGVSFGKVNNYTLGLDALAKVKLLIIEPYIGVGIGFDKVNQSGSNGISSVVGSAVNPENTQKTIYEGVFGTEASLLSFLHPFVEYRTHAPKFGDVLKKPSGSDSQGVWAFGVLLKF